MVTKFKTRSEEEEIMDDLSAGGAVMDQTLRELEVINKWLGGNYVTLNGLDKLIEGETFEHPLQIVDLGCGGGDMLKLIARWADKRDLQVELIGIDANPHVVAFAVQNTRDYTNISYKQVNILSDEFTALKGDIFIATLFMHHFKERELIKLFGQLKKQASIGFVINDIHRHWFAYYSIKWLTTLFSRSPMVRNDAAVSVMRSFHKSELQAVLEQSDITDYSIRWMWAFRWQLVVG